MHATHASRRDSVSGTLCAGLSRPCGRTRTFSRCCWVEIDLVNILRPSIAHSRSDSIFACQDAGRTRRNPLKISAQPSAPPSATVAFGVVIVSGVQIAVAGSEPDGDAQSYFPDRSLISRANAFSARPRGRVAVSCRDSRAKIPPRAGTASLRPGPRRLRSASTGLRAGH